LYQQIRGRCKYGGVAVVHGGSPPLKTIGFGRSLCPAEWAKKTLKRVMTWMEKHRLCPKMLKDERLNLATWGYLEKNCKRHFRYVDLYMRSPTKKLHVLDQLNATNNCILIKPKESPAWGLFDNAGPVLYEIFNEPFGYSDPQE
jgi:hypothetical protein